MKRSGMGIQYSQAADEGVATGGLLFYWRFLMELAFGFSKNISWLAEIA